MLFDEATSALDPVTERQLLANILSDHDKTVIFITHRTAVVDYCDQTLRLNRTTTSEDDTHPETEKPGCKREANIEPNRRHEHL